MKNNKKLLFLCCVSVLVLSIGGTLAYFTYLDRLKNQFTVGHSSITIEEEFKPPKELEAGKNIFKKRVQIKNDGTVPCFIRVYTDFSSSKIKKLASISPDGIDFIPAESYQDHLPEGWEYIEETDTLLGGYYYWTMPVEVGDVTAPLFDTVKVTFENVDQVKDFDIILYSECVQVLDKDGAEFPGAEPWKQAWTEFLERR